MKLFKKKVEEPVVENTAVAGGADMAADLDAVMRKYDRESATRIWEGVPKMVMRVLMAAFSLYCIGMTLWSVELPETKLARFIAFIIILGYLTYPAKKGSLKVNYIPWYDIVLMVLGAGAFLYFAFGAMEIIKLATMIQTHHVIIGLVGLLVLAELCRRCVGLPILFVAGFFIIYTFTTGKNLPRVSYELFFWRQRYTHHAGERMLEVHRGIYHLRCVFGAYGRRGFLH